MDFVSLGISIVALGVAIYSVFKKPRVPDVIDGGDAHGPKQ